jgi:hypothetical protein
MKVVLFCGGLRLRLRDYAFRRSGDFAASLCLVPCQDRHWR